MTSQQFDTILNDRMEKIKSVLASKATEYATEDRLHNFKSTGTEFGQTPTEVCWGYMFKHLTSVKDLAFGFKPVTAAMIDEKVGDAINYLVLTEALFRESLPKGGPQ